MEFFLTSFFISENRAIITNVIMETGKVLACFQASINFQL